MARYRVRDLGALRDRMANSQRVVPHSVRSLAQQVGANRATVGHVLSGERERLDGVLAQRIAVALGASFSDLFVEDDSPSGDGCDGLEGESA